MADPTEDTRVFSADEVAEITGEAEEEDESGASERAPRLITTTRTIEPHSTGLHPQLRRSSFPG